jgi:Tol biopolymer transport system component
VNRRTSDSPWDVWITDLERNVSRQLTLNNQNDYWPLVWSPDGSAVVFSARRAGKPAFDLYRRSADGRGTDELLFESREDKQPSGFSPDGKLLLFNRGGVNKDYDVWALPMEGDRKPFAVIATEHQEHSAVFSPDGRWLAYVSEDYGSGQVRVRPFPSTGVGVQLSPEGGRWPIWSADGRTVFYSTPNRLWSVGVTRNGDVLQAQTPHVLFSRTFFGSGFGSFAVDPAGERFLLVVPAQQERDADFLKVVMNWPALLK